MYALLVVVAYGPMRSWHENATSPSDSSNGARQALCSATMQVVASGRIYVAVIDDDDNQRRSFERLLRAAGMEPITYATAEEFLADGARPSFDCLVLDVQLPGMSGLRLQEQLSAEGNQAAIVFITAYDDPSYREQANAMGCSGYFRKSDSGREVLDAIQMAVGRHPRTS